MKKLQDLTIKDAFMFAAVMSDAEQCKLLLALILEMDILEVDVVAEKSLSYHPEYHGVRLLFVFIRNIFCRQAKSGIWASRC